MAFPTETVYGLGADAERAESVRRIFAIKGRPATHPLIVHLASAEDLSGWGKSLSQAAFRLAEAFWPGPLTLIVQRSARVPLEVTGGLETVGLRVPSHPVAKVLLSTFGGGVAAPSANRFGAVSPTTAEHVVSDLGDEVDLVLDGGPCTIGVESTIVDVSGETPVLLRPGGVPAEALEEVLGGALARRGSPAVRAPGMLPSHYAPRARVELVGPSELAERVAAACVAGRKVGVLDVGPEGTPLPENVAVRRLAGSDLDRARRLYQALRELDQAGCEIIYSSLPEERGLGLAIADRLRRAAGPRD